MKNKQPKVLIKLSKEESLRVAEKLINPPEPNNALRELMKNRNVSQNTRQGQ